MKLLTIRTPNGTRAVRQVDDVLIKVDGFNDVGMLLRNPDWRSIADAADGDRHSLSEADLAPVIPVPGCQRSLGIAPRRPADLVGPPLAVQRLCDS